MGSRAGEPRLTSPSVLRALLARHGLEPSQALGQHFLVDSNVLNRILAAAGLGPADPVLEIGPGLGTLTRALADAAGRVVAVELDRRLGPVLAETLAGRTNVELVLGDVLRVDLEKLLQPGRPAWVVVANLPYGVTGPVLGRLVEGTLPIRRAVLMVQLEVARRMAAAAGTPAYGALSVAVQYRARVEVVARVSPRAFYPPPEVTSAICRLDWWDRPPVAVPPGQLFAVVRAAFGQRRKTLANSLAAGLGLPKPAVEAALRQAGIDPGLRGERLDLEAFARVAEVLGPPPEAGPQA